MIYINNTHAIIFAQYYYFRERGLVWCFAGNKELSFTDVVLTKPAVRNLGVCVIFFWKGEA